MSFKNWLKGRSPGVEILDRNGVRSLHLGGTAIQSAIRLATPDMLELHYTRTMMAALLFNDAPRELLMIGLGGGSIVRFAYSRLPDTRTTAVEVQPEVVAAARAWFGVPPDDARLNVEVADGLAYLQAHPRSADLLLMDAFEGHESPPHLRTLGAYEACYEALRPHGILVQNFMASDSKLDTCLERLTDAFDRRVLTLPSGDRANTIAFGFRTATRRWPIEHLKARAIRLEQQFELSFQAMLKDLLAHNACSASQLLLGDAD
jgi:spermidine synthase